MESCIECCCGFCFGICDMYKEETFKDILIARQNNSEVRQNICVRKGLVVKLSKSRAILCLLFNCFPLTAGFGTMLSACLA